MARQEEKPKRHDCDLYNDVQRMIQRVPAHNLLSASLSFGRAIESQNPVAMQKCGRVFAQLEQQRPVVIVIPDEAQSHFIVATQQILVSEFLAAGGSRFPARVLGVDEIARANKTDYKTVVKIFSGMSWPENLKKTVESSLRTQLGIAGFLGLTVDTR